MANVCNAAVGKCGERPAFSVHSEVTEIRERYAHSNVVYVTGHRLTTVYGIDGRVSILPDMDFRGDGSREAAGILTDVLAIGLRAVLVEGVKP
jgi:hypothetical protein